MAYALGLGGLFLNLGCGIGGADGLFASGGVGGGGQNTGGQGGVINPSGGGQGGDPSTSTTNSTTVSSTNASSTTVSSSAVASSSTGMQQGDLDCGDGVQCNRGGQRSCCWDQFMRGDEPYGVCNDGMAGSDGCNTQISETGLHARITCETPAQCPGSQFCCGHRVFFMGNNAYYDAVDCKPSCDDPDVRLCDPNDNADTCEGGSCNPSQLLPPGYFVCGN